MNLLKWFVVFVALLNTNIVILMMFPETKSIEIVLWLCNSTVVGMLVYKRYLRFWDE